MKKVIILLAVFLMPLLAFAQNYDLETAKKFYKAKDILDNAKGSFSYASWGAIGTAGSGSTLPTRSKYYNVERIQTELKAEGLDVFLKDENNRIALASLAEFVTDHSSYLNWHNDYETLRTIGINPVEAAIRTNNDEYIQSALENGEITYKHCYTRTHSYVGGGSSSAITETNTDEVTTSSEEVEAIRKQLANEKPLIEQFNKEMKKLKKQIRKEKYQQALTKLTNKIENIGNRIDEAAEGINYMHW